MTGVFGTDLLNTVDAYDLVVVGAGLSGAVIAQQLAQQGKTVLVVEQRNHVAGNCFDYVNEYGVCVHQYGPHLFHTDNETVWDYLSTFTEWHPYEHRVLADIDNRLGPIPFNLNSLECWFNPEVAERLAKLLIDTYGFGTEIPIMVLRQSEAQGLRELAEFVYHKLFLNYTVKQWGVTPEQISPEVVARVPVRISYDDRYFKDRFQAVPVAGYTEMIKTILDHPNITLVLATDARPFVGFDKASGNILWCNKVYLGRLIYTGMLDELFDYCYGQLSYRSLQFQFQTLGQSEYQPATTVNYPNHPAMTRVTEFKHILGLQPASTTIVTEYPRDYIRDGDEKNIPYYPMLNAENMSRYNQYKTLASAFSRFYPVGRLAEYRYYDMDDAVANALLVAENLLAEYQT
ncbi:MAG: UDP-galactopyranose mutase [Hahellaceae bacterium]|nr:UDP-galactopyranose mutase [Hahellaceae bacterium]MCP5211747.1 UDP-galactopyranose mutase [Hahellaceae bacterium]